MDNPFGVLLAKVLDPALLGQGLDNTLDTVRAGRNLTGKSGGGVVSGVLKPVGQKVRSQASMLGGAVAPPVQPAAIGETQAPTAAGSAFGSGS